MTKDEDFKLLKIQTCILRVNLHCDGCKQKVKKLLQKIEGVYQVNIDAEQQKVTVSGSVESATLIKKLVRAGKHAEVWSNKSSQNQNQNQNQSQNHQNQKGSCVKDGKKNNTQKQDFVKGLETLKNQPKFQPLISDEDYDSLDDNDDDESAEELRFLRENANHLGLLRQQQQVAAIAANNARNSNGNAKQMDGTGGNGNGKKGSLNQNGGLKMGNDNHNHSGVGGVGLMKGNAVNTNLGEGKRVNDMSSIMNNLAGFHGFPDGGLANGGGGGGFGSLGGFQIPQKNSVQGSGAAGFHLPNGGLPMGTGGHNPSSQAAMMMNMSGAGYNNYQQQQHNNSAAAVSMMMNLQNRQAMLHHHQQQPQPQPQSQMMYHRAPIIPPATGYYYNYNPAPCTYNESPYNNYPYPYPHHHHHTSGGNGGGDSSAAHMFSDENTSSCSVM